METGQTDGLLACCEPYFGHRVKACSSTGKQQNRSHPQILHRSFCLHSLLPTNHIIIDRIFASSITETTIPKKFRSVSGLSLVSCSYSTCLHCVVYQIKLIVSIFPMSIWDNLHTETVLVFNIFMSGCFPSGFRNFCDNTTFVVFLSRAVEKITNCDPLPSWRFAAACTSLLNQ